MGSVGASRSGGGTSANSAEMTRLAERAAYDFASHHMSGNQTSVTNLEVKEIGNIDERGYADVTYAYDANFRIPSPYWDSDLGRMVNDYSEESEYLTEKHRLKLR